MPFPTPRAAAAGTTILRGVSQPVDFVLPLSIEDARRLLTALRASVEAWRRHYDKDAGRTHTTDEWETFRVENGVLIWRLEELAVLPGQAVEHSEYAVRPSDDEDGGAGVREPNGPRPPGPTAKQQRG